MLRCETHHKLRFKILMWDGGILGDLRIKPGHDCYLVLTASFFTVSLSHCLKQTLPFRYVAGKLVEGCDGSHCLPVDLDEILGEFLVWNWWNKTLSSPKSNCTSLRFFSDNKNKTNSKVRQHILLYCTITVKFKLNTLNLKAVLRQGIPNNNNNNNNPPPKKTSIMGHWLLPK